MEVCRDVAEVVAAVERIIDREKNEHPEEGVSFFFRGEVRNYARTGSRVLNPAFSCLLDRDPKWIENERRLYEEALRLNVASFHEDRTMVERVARMQHYQLPTRFADLSDNALLAAHFAAGGGSPARSREKDRDDGFIRVIKVSSDKMKSFTSDIIVAIAHLPLVDAGNIHPSYLDRDGLGYLTFEIKNERHGFYDFHSDVDLYRELCRDLRQVWAFRPVLNNDRIRNQGGAFLAFGCGDCKAPLNPSFSLADYGDSSKPSYGIMQIGYICIPAGCKGEILRQLCHFGMAPERVYPELSNVCMELQEKCRKGE